MIHSRLRIQSPLIHMRGTATIAMGQEWLRQIKVIPIHPADNSVIINELSEHVGVVMDLITEPFSMGSWIVTAIVRGSREILGLNLVPVFAPGGEVDHWTIDGEEVDMGEEHRLQPDPDYIAFDHALGPMGEWLEDD